MKIHYRIIQQQIFRKFAIRSKLKERNLGCQTQKQVVKEPSFETSRSFSIELKRPVNESFPQLYISDDH